MTDIQVRAGSVITPEDLNSLLLKTKERGEDSFMLLGRYLNNECIKILSECVFFKTVALSGYITDDDIKILVKNKSIRSLAIGSSNVTDVGAYYLSQSTSLENLWLDTNKIGHRGVFVLKQMADRGVNIVFDGVKL